MTALQALILGIVQGLGEFLPISSSGHLVLLQKIFGISEGAMSFDIVVHLGTLVSLLIVMREKIMRYVRHPLGHVPKMVALGTVPTVAIALVFNGLLEGLFESGASLGIGFVFTAALLWYAERRSRKGGAATGASAAAGAAAGAGAAREDAGATGDGRGMDGIRPRDALTVGVAQGIAIVPAISRSGSTIAGGLLSGLGREAAIEYAFLMAIPVTLMAVALDALKIIVAVSGGSYAGAPPREMLIGAVAAMVTGLFAAKFMLSMIKKISLSWFAAYVLALGLLVLADQLWFGVFF
ncbi:MAG: undecaprenyl-diphosphate phosphatase [Clostridiales bacterium]|nr:undecaprenyl-diphosphate phosphatase [Clostridiales bacterium]